MGIDPVEMMKRALKLDDSFAFRCDQCGDCCRHREDILISPYDLFRIARHLSVTPESIIDRYFIYYIGNDSNLPLVILKAQGEDRLCPFLLNNRCSIHSAKPSVCGLFPLGRMAAVHDGQSSETLYFLQPLECGKRDQTQTVRQWLKDFGLDQSDEWFQVWQKYIIMLSKLIKLLVTQVPPNLMSKIFSAIFYAMYLNYNMAEDFLPQFKNNMQNLVDALRATIDKS